MSDTFQRMGGRAKREGGRHSEERAARNARSKAYMNLASVLASVFSAGVYTKQELQSAVCTYVAEMKEGGETGDAVVRSALSLVTDVGARFPASARTQLILADMLQWCLAEYYRESA